MLAGVVPVALDARNRAERREQQQKEEAYRGEQLALTKRQVATSEAKVKADAENAEFDSQAEGLKGLFAGYPEHDPELDQLYLDVVSRKRKLGQGDTKPLTIDPNRPAAAPNIYDPGYLEGALDRRVAAKGGRLSTPGLDLGKSDVKAPVVNMPGSFDTARVGKLLGKPKTQLDREADEGKQRLVNEGKLAAAKEKSEVDRLKASLLYEVRQDANLTKAATQVSQVFQMMLDRGAQPAEAWNAALSANQELVQTIGARFHASGAGASGPQNIAPRPNGPAPGVQTAPTVPQEPPAPIPSATGEFGSGGPVTAPPDIRPASLPAPEVSPGGASGGPTLGGFSNDQLFPGGTTAQNKIEVGKSQVFENERQAGLYAAKAKEIETLMDGNRRLLDTKASSLEALIQRQLGTARYMDALTQATVWNTVLGQRKQDATEAKIAYDNFYRSAGLALKQQEIELDAAIANAKQMGVDNPATQAIVSTWKQQIGAMQKEMGEAAKFANAATDEVTRQRFLGRMAELQDNINTLTSNIKQETAGPGQPPVAIPKPTGISTQPPPGAPNLGLPNRTQGLQPLQVPPPQGLPPGQPQPIPQRPPDSQAPQQSVFPQVGQNFVLPDGTTFPRLAQFNPDPAWQSARREALDKAHLKVKRPLTQPEIIYISNFIDHGIRTGRIKLSAPAQ